MTTRQTRRENQPRTRRFAGSLGLLLALLVSSFAPLQAAPCCDPATTVEFAACGSACCEDSSVCAPRTLEAAVATTSVSQNARLALLESSIGTVVPAAAKGTLALTTCAFQASARPPLRDTPLLV